MKLPSSFLQCVSACLFVLAGAGVLLGCTQKSAAPQGDPVFEAYRLIDEQRTTEAIELLEVALLRQPGNVQYKSVLASAYAHKAGIRIQALVPALTQADQLKRTEFRPLEPYTRSTRDEKVQIAMLNIAGLLKAYAGFSDAFSTIPTVTKNEAALLMHAISLLESIGPSISAEDALYRAVLEVVLFKHIVANELVGEFLPPPRMDLQSCRLDLGRVNDAVIKLGKLLIDIYSDMGHANPDQAAETRRMAMNTANAVSNFTLATTSIVVFDEAASLLFKQSLIQGGFGRMIKCGGF